MRKFTPLFCLWLVLACVMFVVSPFAEYFVSKLGYINLAYAISIVGVCCSIRIVFGAADHELARVDEFKEIFKFDPRRHRQDDFSAGIITVNFKIEYLRLKAKTLFVEQQEILRSTKNRKEVVRTINERLGEILLKIAEAKKNFWDAVNIARKWGYKVPSSINQPAISPFADL